MGLLLDFGYQLMDTFTDLGTFLFENTVDQLMSSVLDGDGMLTDIYDIIVWFLPSIGSFTLFELMVGSGLTFLLAFSIIRFIMSAVP